MEIEGNLYEPSGEVLLSNESRKNSDYLKGVMLNLATENFYELVQLRDAEVQTSFCYVPDDTSHVTELNEKLYAVLRLIRRAKRTSEYLEQKNKHYLRKSTHLKKVLLELKNQKKIVPGTCEVLEKLLKTIIKPLTDQSKSKPLTNNIGIEVKDSM